MDVVCSIMRLYHGNLETPQWVSLNFYTKKRELMLKHIPYYATLYGRQLFADKKADTSHVLVYGAIEVHSMGELGCIASNETIAAETGLTLGTVKKTVSMLKAAGWIDTYVNKATNQRSIDPKMDLSIGGKKLVTPEYPAEKVVTPEYPAGYPGVTPIYIDTGIDTDKIESKLSIKKVKGNYTEKDVEVVEILRAMVAENFPYIKNKPPRRDDYEAINKLHRLDGHSYEDIILMIKWVQQDDFWKQNIRSAVKLRIKFDELQIRGRAWFAKKQKSRIVEV